MADKQKTNKDELTKRVNELREKVAKQRAASKEPRQDAELRKLVKELKRAQRRLAQTAAPTLDDRLKSTQKRVDIVGKLLSDMTKGMKKVQGDPYVHSLRKKTKSLNKRVKKLNRLIAKAKKDAPAAPATPPPA